MYYASPVTPKVKLVYKLTQLPEHWRPVFYGAVFSLNFALVTHVTKCTFLLVNKINISQLIVALASSVPLEKIYICYV